MFAWMMRGIKKISIEFSLILFAAIATTLVIYFSSFITSLLACCALGMMLGFLMVKLFPVKGGARSVREGSDKETSYNKMGDMMNRSDTTNKVSLTSSKPVPEPSAASFANTWYARFSGFFSGVDAAFSNTQKRHSPAQELRDAVARCVQEEESQSHDIAIINGLYDEFIQEATSILRENSRRSLVAGVPLRHVDGGLIRRAPSRDEKETNAQSDILHDLIANYPGSEFEDNLSVENIERYIEAIREHHAKVILAAEALFPNLHSFLRETRVMQNSQPVSSFR